MPFSPFNRWGLASPFNRWGPVGANPLASYTFDDHAPVTLVDFDNDFFWANGEETDEATILDSGDETGCRIGAAYVPDLLSGCTVIMHGLLSYTDDNLPTQASFFSRVKTGTEYIRADLRTDSTRVGDLRPISNNVGGGGGLIGTYGVDALAPGTNVPFGFALSFTANAIDGAVDGVVSGSGTGTNIYPNLAGRYVGLLQIGSGTISWFGIYEGDIGEAGRLAGSTINF